MVFLAGRLAGMTVAHLFRRPAAYSTSHFVSGCVDASRSLNVALGRGLQGADAILNQLNCPLGHPVALQFTIGRTLWRDDQALVISCAVQVYQGLIDASLDGFS